MCVSVVFLQYRIIKYSTKKRPLFWLDISKVRRFLSIVACFLQLKALPNVDKLCKKYTDGTRIISTKTRKLMMFPTHRKSEYLRILNIQIIFHTQSYILNQYASRNIFFSVQNIVYCETIFKSCHYILAQFAYFYL